MTGRFIGHREKKRTTTVMNDWGVWLVFVFIVVGIVALALLSAWGAERRSSSFVATDATKTATTAASKQVRFGSAVPETAQHQQTAIATMGSTANGVRTVPKPVGVPEVTDTRVVATGTGASTHTRSGPPVSTAMRPRKTTKTKPNPEKDQTFKREWSKTSDRDVDEILTGGPDKRPIYVPSNPIRVSLEFPGLAGRPGKFVEPPPFAQNQPTVDPCELTGLYVDSSRYLNIASTACAAIHPKELQQQNDPSFVN